MTSKPTIIFDPYPRNEEMVFTSDVEKELNQISKLISHFGSRAPDELVEEKFTLNFISNGGKYLYAIDSDECEQYFNEILKDANNKKCKIKYVAELNNGKASVGLKLIPKGHDFYNLEGSDNIVLFYTDRYHTQPLIVKGAGAGAEVTAAGIFGDIIRIGKR